MEQPVKYRSAFLKSIHHAVLGISTIGVGFMTGHPFLLILGIVGYILGWLYIPDMPFFRKSIDDKNSAMLAGERRLQRQAFIEKRDSLISNLNFDLGAKYRELVGYCEDIERETSTTHILAGSQDADIRTRKLDELMWTYLRLLCMDQSLSTFLKTEKEEYVQQQIDRLEEEIKAISLPKEAENSPQERLVLSKTSMLDTLKKRISRIKDSKTNIELVRAEQSRLVEQIKLLRADSFAMQNSELLSQRIDASMEQLEQTNKWLSEMDTIKDSMETAVPVFDDRIGYGVSGERVQEDFASDEASAPKVRRVGYRSKTI